MGYFELFEESPALFFLVLIISLVITLLVYSAFPIIFARVRKTPITKKKYKWLCFGINVTGIILFAAFNGEVSGAAYILWTWIFSNYGAETLEAKGLLSDTAPTEKKTVEAELPNDGDHYQHCDNTTVLANEEADRSAQSGEQKKPSHDVLSITAVTISLIVIIASLLVIFLIVPNL